MKPENKVGNEVIEHWYSLVSAQHFSSKDFYGHIEAGIAAQKVPALEISRIDLSEGGVLSDKREYLRMKRERLTFDVCAAPVGVNYFFSYRFYVEPAIVTVWDVISLFVGFGVLTFLFAKVGGIIGLFIFGAVVALAFFLMKNAIGMGLRDLDASLIKTPALGPIYERYFRKDTYYRQDIRIAYCSIVSGLVKQETARITGEKGVEFLREFTYSPVLQDLYRVKDMPTGKAGAPEPVQT